jgi:hypothetical protein
VAIFPECILLGNLLRLVVEIDHTREVIWQQHEIASLINLVLPEVNKVFILQLGDNSCSVGWVV